ncbi:MAG: hypothetical protein ACXVMS_14285 [Flavisolibacter sp.]
MLELFWQYSDTAMPLLSMLTLIRIKKFQQQELFLLGYFVGCSIIFGISNFMADRGINNMVVYHCFSLFEILIVFQYARSFFRSRKIHRLLMIILAVYSLYWLVNIWVWEPLTVFNSNSASISCLLIFIVCGSFFLSLSARKELLYFQKLPQFWVATAFLIYCAWSIPIIVSYKYKEIFYDLDLVTAWHIQVGANCIKFALLSYASLCSYKYQDGLS